MKCLFNCKVLKAWGMMLVYTICFTGPSSSWVVVQDEGKSNVTRFDNGAGIYLAEVLLSYRHSTMNQEVGYEVKILFFVIGRWGNIGRDEQKDEIVQIA